MSGTRRPFFYQQTDGIRITVRPAFESEHSNAVLGQYKFSYRIRIENVGAQGAQLRTRRWLIHDPVGGDNVVEGEGIVGEQPHLRTGAVHEYQSFCVLRSPNGWMEGVYRFVRDDGSSFLATIPRFTLSGESPPDFLT